MEIPARILPRILSNTKPGPDGCLISKYSIGSHGYPQIGWDQDGKHVVTLCHLVLWKIANGPIPPGMTVDHRCRRKRCVNVEHYRLLTNFENARRTNGRDWPLGECAQGHDDATNWHEPPGGSKGYCKECRNAARRRRRAAQRKALV